MPAKIRRIEHVAGLLQAGDDADGLQGSQRNGNITGDAVDLLLAFLAAVLLKTLQGGDGNGQQLHNNAGVDVGSNAHGHDGHLAEGVTGHHVDQPQHIVVAGHFLHNCGVDAGYRNHADQAEQHQHQESVDQLFTEFFDLPCVTQRFPHFRSPRLSRRRPRSFLLRIGCTWSPERSASWSAHRRQGFSRRPAPA